MQVQTFATVLSVAAALLVSVLNQLTSTQGSWKILEGTWKMNGELSTFNPGPGPRGQTVRWERVPDGYRFIEDITRPNGQVAHQVTMETEDGRDAEVQGAAVATRRLFRQIDARTFEGVDKVNGKITTTRRAIVAPDGRRMTVTMTGTNAQGESVNNLAVFERQ